MTESNAEPSAFERRLQNRRMPDPSAALQGRIMAAVGRELSKPSSPDNVNGDWLSFAAAVAAVLIIGANLALTATSTISLNARPSPTPQQARAGANDLRELDIGLSTDDATRISLLFHGGEHMARLPEPRAGAFLMPGPPINAKSEGNLQ